MINYSFEGIYNFENFMKIRHLKMHFFLSACLWTALTEAQYWQCMWKACKSMKNVMCLSTVMFNSANIFVCISSRLEWLFCTSLFYFCSYKEIVCILIRYIGVWNVFCWVSSSCQEGYTQSDDFNKGIVVTCHITCHMLLHNVTLPRQRVPSP